MEELSIWNNIITLKQRYLNMMHGITRLDNQPRRTYNQGKLTNTLTNSIKTVLLHKLNIHRNLEYHMLLDQSLTIKNEKLFVHNL